MPKVEFIKKKKFLHRANYLSGGNESYKSQNININTLLNRVKVNKKKEKINKLTLLGLSSLSLLILGIIIF